MNELPKRKPASKPNVDKANAVKKNKPSSSDVAALANVSQSAVSRSFTPGASVSAATRAKVFKAANQLGYRPNVLARAMISGKSRLIAVPVAYMDNQFYPIVMEKLARALQTRGYQILLFMTETGRQDQVVESLLQYQVQGIVMLSATISSTLANECSQAGIPVVLFNRFVPALSTSSVTSDNIEGGRMVAEFLVAGKHQRIAFIAGDEDSSTNRDREAGFYKGMAQQGQTVWGRAVGGYTFEGAAQAVRKLFAKPEKPDALFVANDHMAFSAIDVIRHECQQRVPEDISVVGYDDVPEAAWKSYDLTTVAQDPDAMIDATINILIKQIENREIKNRAAVIPAKLIVRGSARLPRGGLK